MKPAILLLVPCISALLMTTRLALMPSDSGGMSMQVQVAADVTIGGLACAALAAAAPVGCPQRLSRRPLVCGFSLHRCRCHPLCRRCNLVCSGDKVRNSDIW